MIINDKIRQKKILKAYDTFLAPKFKFLTILEKGVALLSEVYKSTFPFLFGSKTSKKREKKLVKMYDFRAQQENHVFTRFFSRFYHRSDF